jgi:hypothetical protein
MTTDLNRPSWWGGENRASGRPSLLGLIDNGTMDTQTAALLWLLVDRGSSILAAAGPQLAGKTTLPPRFWTSCHRLWTRLVNRC